MQLTAAVEAALQELTPGLLKGLAKSQVLFHEADFIQTSVGNVGQTLRDGAVMVAASCSPSCCWHAPH